MLIAEKISKTHYLIVFDKHKCFVSEQCFAVLQNSEYAENSQIFKERLVAFSDFVLRDGVVLKAKRSVESLILNYIGVETQVQIEAQEDKPNSVPAWIEHDGTNFPEINYFNQKITWNYRNGFMHVRRANSTSFSHWENGRSLSGWRGWIHAQESDPGYHIISYMIEDDNG